MRPSPASSALGAYGPSKNGIISCRAHFPIFSLINFAHQTLWKVGCPWKLEFGKRFAKLGHKEGVCAVWFRIIYVENGSSMVWYGFSTASKKQTPGFGTKLQYFVSHSKESQELRDRVADKTVRKKVSEKSRETTWNTRIYATVSPLQSDIAFSFSNPNRLVRQTSGFSYLISGQNFAKAFALFLAEVESHPEAWQNDIYIYTVICSITFEWFLDILGKCIMFSTQEKLESAVEKRRDILEKKFLREPKIIAANDEKNSASSAKPRSVEDIQATEAVLPNSKACPMLGIRICEVKVVSMWNGLKWSKWKQCASQWPHNDFVVSCLMLDLNEYVDHCWSIEILKSPFVTLRCHRCSEFTFPVFAFWSKQVICLETYAIDFRPGSHYHIVFVKMFWSPKALFRRSICWKVVAFFLARIGMLAVS